jgi:hypothetical protein
MQVCARRHETRFRTFCGISPRALVACTGAPCLALAETLSQPPRPQELVEFTRKLDPGDMKNMLADDEFNGLLETQVHCSLHNTLLPTPLSYARGPHLHAIVRLYAATPRAVDVSRTSARLISH